MANFTNNIDNQIAPYLTLSALVLSIWFVVFILVAFIGVTIDSLISLSPIVCPFKALTAIECPGCGMTRAFVAIAQLDLRSAFYYNPFSIPLFIGIVISALNIKINRFSFDVHRIHLASLLILLSWWTLARLIPGLTAIFYG